MKTIKILEELQSLENKADQLMFAASDIKNQIAACVKSCRSKMMLPRTRKSCKNAEPERLPDVPDWRDGAARQAQEDQMTQIRLIVAAHAGESMADILAAIKAAGISKESLVQSLGITVATAGKTAEEE